MLLRWLSPLLTAPALAFAAPGTVCVTNATPERLLFAAEIPPAPRVLAWLAPGATLCAGPGEAETGIVSAYAEENALEGCSRLVRRGRAEILLAYADFDNCLWSSQE